MSEQPSFLVEEQQPKNRSILIWGVIIGVTVAIVMLVLSTVFSRSTEQAIFEKQLSSKDPALENLKDIQQQQLHSYGWVDASKQVVHIPIEEAMKKILIQNQGKEPPQ